MPQYAKKILFNITQTDLDRMTDMCVKRGLSHSEYIRQAIRMRVAEHIIQEMEHGGSAQEFGTYACKG